MYGNSFIENFLPFCLEQKHGEPKCYYVLNKFYMPVGLINPSSKQRDDYPVLVKLSGLTASVVKRLSVHGDPFLGQIYLYESLSKHPLVNKACMDAYLKRLALLAKLKIVDHS